MLFYRAQEEENDRQVRLKLFHRTRAHPPLRRLAHAGKHGAARHRRDPIGYAPQRRDLLDPRLLHAAARRAAIRSGPEPAALPAGLRRHLEQDPGKTTVSTAALGPAHRSPGLCAARLCRTYIRARPASPSSQSHIEETLTRYPDIAELLSPCSSSASIPPANRTPGAIARCQALAKLHEQLAAKLDQVANLDDDRIIRRYGEMIDATLRTNLPLQPDKEGQASSPTSLQAGPLQHHRRRMPPPLPKFEIFVYSLRVEGCICAEARWPVAACAGPIARRTSATEALVWSRPAGEEHRHRAGGRQGRLLLQADAGGRPAPSSREEGKRLLPPVGIRGLPAMLTDNIISGEVILPKSVVRHDEDDYYLVVAADSGHSPPSPTSPTR